MTNSPTKPKVLLLGTLDHASTFWQNHITPLAETITTNAPDRASFLKECHAGQYTGVTAAYRTFGSASQTGPWDSDLCAALPTSLRFVAHNGAGYDQLSTDALTANNIVATNVPTAVDDATADTALFLMLGALRFQSTQFALADGKWRGDPPPMLGNDPEGKTLGILGMGGIGRNLVRKCKPFGMKVLYHNRKPLPTSETEGATYVSLDELLAQSDILSVHVPLNSQTRHLLGAAELAKCKKGQCIVNTARGAVIDEAALVDALNQGHIKSAGLDVYEEEPKVHPGLVKHERAFLLPHMGTWTKETQEAMEEWCIENVERAVRGLKGEKGQWEGMSVVGEQKELIGKWIREGAPEGR
ncbi:MAG: hypothetical protein Q9162_005182 [Coniocarpon cinnabarinum]